ncbi:MAG: hypothetical protein FWD37_04635, partial [Methanomassiliicoccaceae archaeon]|nr:hypothetical protein [Methanomassiliicoccaceae archaeon]
TGAVRELPVKGYDSKTMKIYGNTGTAEGLHIATIALKDKNNYTWDDGTVGDVDIEWNIVKMEFTLSKGTFFGGKLYWSVNGGNMEELISDVILFSGTEVTIKAVADRGNMFVKWTKGLSGTVSEVTFIIDGDIIISADFKARGPLMQDMWLLPFLVFIVIVIMFVTYVWIKFRSDDEED